MYRGAGETLVDLNTLGGNDSSAYALNNAGVIVGEAQRENGEWRAAKWSGEVIAELGVLPEGGGSRALDINDAGIAAGDASGSDGMTVAVRYVDGQVEDLNDKLPEDSPWQLDKASGINDLGEITGIGRLAEDSAPRAFLSAPLSLPPLFATEQRFTPIPIDQVPASETRYSVAIDGDTLAIGNPDDSELGDQAGAVYIYQRQNDEWVFRAKVKAEDGGPSREFGRAVALEGGRLVVGHQYRGVYVFNGAAENWLQLQRLNGSNVSVRSTVLALSGNTLATRFNGDGEFEKGAVIYIFDGTGWEEGAVTETFTSIFEAIALQGEYLFVGRGWFIDVYKIQDDGLVKDQSLILGTNVDALAVDGDTLVVGGSDWSSYMGIVHVYRQRNGKWFQHAILHSSGRNDSVPWRVAAEGPVGERFGQSVAIDGDIIAVGAPFGNEDKDGAGAIYIFQRHGNQWIEEAKLTTSDPPFNQQLGWAVAMDDGVVVGSTDHRPDGAVYSYTLNHSPDSVDLRLLMSVDRNVVGKTELATHTLTVANLSDAVAATGIDVTVLLPSELNLVSGSDGCGPEEGVIICHIDRVPESGLREVTIIAKALKEGDATSEAWVSAYQHDPDRSNNEVNLDILIEEELPPRIVNLEPHDGDVVTLTPHDTLHLSFEVENFQLEPAGQHVHWWLNDDPREDLYDNMVDITDLGEGEYTVKLILAEADDTEVSQTFSTSFTIERPPWPGVTIEPIPNSDSLVEGSSVQVRYAINLAGDADGPEDFWWTINGSAPERLTDMNSLSFEGLSPGEYAVEIGYEASTVADARATFTIVPNSNEEQGPSSEEPGDAGGGGGRLDWLTMMLLAVLVSVNGLHIAAKRCY